MQRQPRGSVAIEEKQGKWRIRLPRAVALDSSRYISTSLEATADNLKKVQRVVWDIEEDIRIGNLDPSLSRYTQQFKPKLTVVKPLQGLTLDELWTRYCDYRKPQVAITTYIREYQGRYASHIKKLPTKDLSEAIAIREYITSNLSLNTAKRLLTQISACCKWAVKSGLIQKNPFADMAAEVKLANKEADSIDPFSLAERDAILSAFSCHPKHSHYYPFVRFLFLTGCRTGEAVALQWKHINKDCTVITFAETYNNRLKIRKDTKTHKVRKFPCNPVLKELLLSIRPDDYKPDDYVFTSTTRLPIDTHNFTNRIWKGCKYSGKTYRGIVTALVEAGMVDRYRCLYNTRHTFITMALEGGVTVPQVAKLVGNSPEVILKHYAGSLLKFEIPVV